MKDRKLQNSAVVTAALIAAIAALQTNTRWLSAKTQEAVERERCYGVVRAAHNDCANGKHSCAGQAATSGSPEEWLMLPNGLCNRIVGGSRGST